MKPKNIEVKTDEARSCEASGSPAKVEAALNWFECDSDEMPSDVFDILGIEACDNPIEKMVNTFLAAGEILSEEVRRLRDELAEKSESDEMSERGDAQNG